MNQPAVRVERRGEAAWVVLDDARRRNPLSATVLGRLRTDLTDLGRDRSVKVIVLSHEGPAFSAGHDLREMTDRDRAFHDELLDTCVDVMLGLHRVPQPVVARVDGVATAAGCQLVASCDLVVASDRSSFATPGVRIGLFCSTPMVALSRAIGRKRALQMLLTGEPVDAATAADWGLVNFVVPTERLDDTVDGLVDSLTRWSAHTLRIGKEAFYRQIELSEDDAYTYTKVVMAENATDAVAAEGMCAFLEKRPPVWPDMH